MQSNCDLPVTSNTRQHNQLPERNHGERQTIAAFDDNNSRPFDLVLLGPSILVVFSAQLLYRWHQPGGVIRADNESVFAIVIAIASVPGFRGASFQ